MRRFIMLGSVLALLIASMASFGEGAKDTPKAAETRKLLQQKVTVEYTDTFLYEAIDDLKSQVKGLTFKLDTAGGVSKNLKVSFKGEDKTVAEVLEGMFKKNGCGYIVISKQGNAYDGIVQVKQGKERGYPLGEEPDAASTKVKASADKSSGKDKSKDKTASKTKTAKAKDKTGDDAKPDDDADKAEHDAGVKLGFAKTLLDDGKTAKAKERLEELVEKYPKTKAATEAKELLKKLEP